MTSSDIRNIFKDNFSFVNDFAPRDHEYEKAFVQSATAELYLLRSLESDDFRAWLPNARFEMVLGKSIIAHPLPRQALNENEKHRRELKKAPLLKSLKRFQNRPQPTAIVEKGGAVTYVDPCHQDTVFYSVSMSNDNDQRPLLHLYREINEIASTEKAVQEIIDQFKERYACDRGREPEAAGLECGFKAGPFWPPEKLDEYRFNSERFFYGEISAGNVNSRVVWLPKFSYKKQNGGRLLTVPVPPSPCPLYAPSIARQYPLQKEAKFVVLSDSLMLVQKNQISWNLNRVKDWVWAGFYAPDGELSNVNWQALSGKHVMYVLHQHSGYSREDVLETAEGVLEQLKSVKKSEVTFVSYLPDHALRSQECQLLRKSPLIFSRKRFDVLMRASRARKGRSDDRGSQIVKARYTRHPWLFRPFLRRQTASLLIGSPGSGKSLFGLHMAYAVSQGMKLFSGWEGVKPHGVAYFYEEGLSACFEERLKTLMRLQMGNHPNLLQRHQEMRVAWGNESRLHFPQKNPGGIPEACATVSRGTMKQVPLVHYNNFLPMPFERGTFDITAVDVQVKILDRIASVRIPMGENFYKLIVFDGFGGLENLYQDPELLEFFVRFLDELRMSGCAVLVIPRGRAGGRAAFRKFEKNLPFDNVVQVRKEYPTVPAGIAMSIKVLKAMRPPAGFSGEVKVEILPDAEVPEWTLRREGRTPNETVREMIKLEKDEGLNIRQIAERLGESESQIKKLRSALVRSGRLRRKRRTPRR